MRAANDRPRPRALERALTEAIRGEVRFSEGQRLLYATDGSNYREVPIGVVLPRDAGDVQATLEVCRLRRTPVLARGAGTSLAGQSCNEAVVIDFSRHLNRIIKIDPERRLARVEPGVTLDQLRAAAGPYGLTFGPDPATHAYCTLGGMIGNNSCGVHSLSAGRTEHNVEALRVATIDGAILSVGSASASESARLSAAGGRVGEIHSRLRELRERYAESIRDGFPRIPRSVSGYNLPALLPDNGFNVARSLVGSEGTCAVVLEATVRLVPKPAATALLVLGYPDIFEAADAVPDIVTSGCIGLEGFDDLVVGSMRKKGLRLDGLTLLPEGRGWLLAEFGGETSSVAVEKAYALAGELGLGQRAPAVTLLTDPGSQRELWEVRESALAASVRVPGEPDTWEGWEDAAVAPERLGSYLRDLTGLLHAHGLKAPLYGHFGEGCVHNRIPFDLRSGAGVARYRRFVEEAADLVIAHGGSLSGEHGDGQSRGELLPHVRLGAHERVPRVQIDLGSGGSSQPRQGGRRPPPGREPQVGLSTSAAAACHCFPLSRRRR